MSYLNHDKKEKSIRYFLYARKSSESEDRQIQSIDDQVSVLKELAKDYGLKVIDIITEAKSAKNPGGRPAFNEMVHRLQQGEADGILTWKIDRLSRNPIDSATIQWLLQEEILQSIQTPGREFLPGDNAIIFSVESSMANQYIRDLSRNVKRGLASKVEKGWLPNRAPVGYLNKRDSHGANYIAKDPKRFPLLRKAWDEMLAGHLSVPEIHNLLNDEWGFRSRPWRGGTRKLARNTLYRMFTNPFYAGLLPYNGKTRKGKHPAMVTLDEFDRVQVLLGRKGRPRKKKHTYAYTGLITCGECGGVVSGTSINKKLRSGEVRTHIYYYCINASKKRVPCSQRRYVSNSVLDRQVVAELSTFDLHPSAMTLINLILDTDDQLEMQAREQKQKATKDELAELKRKLITLRHMRMDEMITSDEYKEERVALDMRIEQLEMTLSNDESDSQIHSLKEELTFAHEVVQTFHASDEKGKRELVAETCSNLTLCGEKLAIQSREPFTELKVVSDSHQDDSDLFEPMNGGSTKSLNSYSPAAVSLLRGILCLIQTKILKK